MELKESGHIEVKNHITTSVGKPPKKRLQPKEAESEDNKR